MNVAFLAVLAAIALLTLLWGASSALAFTDWAHDGATKATCMAGCHATEEARDNAACTPCHARYIARPDRYCWSCHLPGQPMASQKWREGACSQTCHTFSEHTPDPCERCHGSYSEKFSHGAAPHVGADSMPCTTCHAVSKSVTDPGGSSHHGGPLPQLADCGACHNGSQGSLKVGHAGKACSVCHDGMDTPAVPATCTKCHTSAKFGSGTCTASACHGTAVIHTAKPSAAGKACATCHADKTTGHYQGVGACVTCHKDTVGYHHGGASPTPADDCAGCHDGAAASKRVSHDGIKDCSFCHTGMDRPDQQKVCGQCHSFGDKVLPTCTVCHGKTGMFKREMVHTPTPMAGVTCKTCHKPHFAELGACDSCHAKTPLMHHGALTVEPSKMTLAVRPSGVKKGRTVVLSGVLTSAGSPRASESVVLRSSANGKKFRTVASLTTGTDGGFTYTVKPRTSTVYQALWKGTSTAKAVVSPASASAKVRVR